VSSYHRCALSFVLLLAVGLAHAASPPTCKDCAQWNLSQQPFRVYGNTYYVGVHGLSSILITSDHGHILIDGDLEESAPKIATSIRALGFKVEDIKLILNSHIHYDHAGGIAELKRMSGAAVAASAASAQVLESGQSGADDPQYGQLPPIAKVSPVKIVKDGETVRVGPLALKAHLTGGHTPGGTTWTWKSCENGRCLQMVYADSLTAVSAADFHFTHNTTYPNVLEDFGKSFATLSKIRCDVLLTPHPDVSDLWSRFEKNEHGGGVEAFIDPTACRRYVTRARAQLDTRVASEKGQ
jgi:metallo-beta-lactamase class B